MAENINFLGGLLGLMLTSVVLIAIPGPSVMFFIGRVLVAGRANAARSVIGNAIGMLIIAMLVAFGLGSLIMQSAAVLMVVRALGAAVLLFIGFQYIRAAHSTISEEKVGAPSQRSPLLSGVIVGLTNPKGLIMFGTIVPSFLHSNTDSPVVGLLFYSLVPIALGLLIDSIWVLSAHAVSSRAVFSQKSMRFINILGGGLIIAMALVLAWEAATAL